MEFWLARAMQVAAIEDEETVQRLHAVEEKRGHCLANWNIQELFKLKTIKDTHHIPEDDELQARHNRRIANELQRRNFLHTESGELVSSVCRRATHSFDWAVFKRKNEIVWEYSGGEAKRGRLRNIVGVSQSKSESD